MLRPVVTLILLLTIPGVARAEGPAAGGVAVAAVPGPAFAGPATIASPERVATVESRGADPVWTARGLLTAPLGGLGGLARSEKAGPAVYDASVGAWFAMSMGQLVRVDEGERLTVVADGIQGTDVDVRAFSGLAVSREPDDTIVLHRFGPAGTGTTVLMRGEAFFHPRFSPDGRRVLVAESRAGGGHMWVVNLADGRATDLGQGYGATWHPDGRTVVFSRVVHDSMRIWAADLYAVDVATGAIRLLALTGDRAEVEPAVSPDGRWVAFVDALTGDLLVGRFPGEEVLP